MVMLCTTRIEFSFYFILLYKPNSDIFFTICWNQNIIISFFEGGFLKGCRKFSFFSVHLNDWKLCELYQYSQYMWTKIKYA